jgi:TetR/AcrR family transcriptional regulator, regulator of autoinduction and epiphytic fitness
VGETHVTDRRIERANRTRDSIVDALLALIEDGNFRPTAREIAARAGVSLRSLYVHFDDVEALFHAAATRHHMHLAEHRLEVRTSGPFEERLVSFVEARTALYEAGEKVRQAALLQEPFSPALHSILDHARRAGRAELDKVFGPELAGPGSARRRAALDVVTHPAAWQILRAQHDLGLEAAKATMCDMVRAVLGPDGPSGGAAPEKAGAKAKRGG